VNQSNDGDRNLLLAASSEQPSRGSTDDLKLTLITEELSVEKETVETGRFGVSKQTHMREVVVDEALLRESAEIETIPIGRRIFEMPSVRRDGDTVVVLIVEQILHTERRLILKEEIQITRRNTTEKFHDIVTLRYQEAVITRAQSSSEAVDDTSTKESK
jgi:stress response protein YsnF